MKEISLDNGRSYMTASEAITEILDNNLWDAVFNVMDADLCEELNIEIAPCTEGEFLAAYLDRAAEDLIIG